MRKISVFAGVVAVLLLVGVGTWIGVGKGASTSALAGSAVNPSAMMTSATDLRAAHYGLASGRGRNFWNFCNFWNFLPAL